MDDKENDLSTETVDLAASELRQNLTHALSLLQASVETAEGNTTSSGSSSLLQVALTEVDKVDQEIEQMLATISQAKVTFTNYCTHLTGLEKLIQQSIDSVSTNSARISNLLVKCLNSGRHRSTPSPTRLSLSRITPQIERMAVELANLDDLEWLDGADMLTQELQFIEGDIKMNTTQFQSMVEQCGVLRRDHGDDSKTTQVEQLFQQNNQLIRACEELIGHFNNVSSHSTNWNACCHDFVNWTDKQVSALARWEISSAKALPNERILEDLKKLDSELNNGTTKQQSVADGTQKLTVAVSRALHSLETNLTLLPTSPRHVFTRRSISLPVNYRWRDSIMSAVGILDDMFQKTPNMVLEYEKSLAHWKHLTNRKEILVNWIETAEAKVNESIELIENQGTDEGAEVWSRQLQEMRCLNSTTLERRNELRCLDGDIHRLPFQTSSDSILVDISNRLNAFEMRLKNHLNFMTDVQQLIDDFNHTAREFDLLMRRTERRISPGEFENEASKLEQCRSIVHQLVIRINSRSYRRHFSRNLSETGKLLQELNSRKSVASEVVSNVVQQFKSLEEEFERLIRPRDSVKSTERSLSDWQYFCRILHRIQSFLDEHIPIIHGLLPTHSLEDTISKLALATSMLARLEDLMVQINTTINALGIDASGGLFGLSSPEGERLIDKYDSSMVYTIRETTSRLNSALTKLKSSIDELKRLQSDWQKYTTDLDEFRHWLLRRVHFSKNNRQGSSFDEIRREGDRLQDLRVALRRLTGSHPRVDFELEKLDSEYRNLLSQMNRGEPPRRGPPESSHTESPRSLRAEVLADLIQTVRHIRSDVDQADVRSERDYQHLHRAFHRTMRRSKSQHC